MRGMTVGTNEPTTNNNNIKKETDLVDFVHAAKGIAVGAEVRAWDHGLAEEPVVRRW